MWCFDLSREDIRVKNGQRLEITGHLAKELNQVGLKKWPLTHYVIMYLYIYSGGTEVTVTGSNLDSVAEPRINLTVYTVRISNNTATYNSSLEVIH